MISQEQVRLAVLGWQYRSALAKLNAKQPVLAQLASKTDKEELKGLSKKERKKLKKKNKKLEKNQKKKEDLKVIHNLVNFDPKKVKISNVPSKTVRKSVWASYLYDYNRPRSLPPKYFNPDEHSKISKSVRGSAV